MWYGKNCLIYSLINNILSQCWGDTHTSSLRFCPPTVSLSPSICVSYQCPFPKARSTRFRDRKNASWCLKPRFRSLQTRERSRVSINIWTRTSHQRCLDLMYRGLEIAHIKQHCWHPECSIYKLVCRHFGSDVAQRRGGKKKLIKIQQGKTYSIKTQICWMVKSQGVGRD